MEPSGGVDQDHVHIPGLGGLDAVKDHAGRVGSLMLADNIRPGPPCPDLQLVRSRRPEGVARHHQDFLALFHQPGSQLADGGSLAHAVDADDQDHAGPGGQVQFRRTYVQHLRQDVLQGVLGLLGGFQVVLPNPLAEPLHGLAGGLHPQVRQDEALLQLVVKIVVQLGKAGKHLPQRIAQGVPGLGETRLDLIKKSHDFLLYSTIPRYSSI